MWGPICHLPPTIFHPSSLTPHPSSVCHRLSRRRGRGQHRMLAHAAAVAAVRTAGPPDSDRRSPTRRGADAWTKSAARPSPQRWTIWRASRDWPAASSSPSATPISCKHADRFRDLGCRVVWVNCMTWLFPEERKHYQRRGPFDGYVFQSRHQQSSLLPQLAKFGVGPDQCHLIRGAFWWEEFPFRPLEHAAGTPCVRRADQPPGRRQVFRQHLGDLPAGPAPDPCPGHGLGPRGPAQGGPAAAVGRVSSGRRRGAAGVSQQAPLHGPGQRRGGGELAPLRPGGHGQRRGGRGPESLGLAGDDPPRPDTGFLADSEDQLAYYAARLAYDEPMRMEIVHRARKVLEEELANPEALWAGWRELLAALDAKVTG